MSTFKYLLFAAGIVAMQSCDSFLGNQPKGYTIPEYYEDYAKLLNHQSLNSTSDVALNFITDDILLTSKNETTVSWFDYQDKDDQQRNLYSFKHGQVLTPGNDDQLWNGAYSNIYTYNAVANNIMNVPDATEQQKRAIRAEALVGRAFEYLNLVNIYGKQYDAKTAATDYGVPIVLSENVGSTATYVRNTVAEVYQRISSDLAEATPDLPDKPTNAYHPGKNIGYAFQARMYLYMGDYQKALENANNALKLSNQLVDYTLYTTKSSTYGRIVLASNTNEEFPDDIHNPENIFMRQLNGTSSLFKSVAASKDLLDTYKSHLATNGEDMRLRLFFATDEANFTVNPNAAPEKFVGYSTYCPYITLNVGFTTPEIYLIAAECEARVGSISRTLELLNTLRDKRIRNNVHYTTKDAPNQTAALRLVLDERRREFALCGPTRLFDLKRLNLDPAFAKEIVHTAEGQTWTLPANDLRYIMPVPQTVLDFKPDMPQYDR